MSEENKKRELPHGLTEREMEVLELVVKGFNNVEIAGILHITNHTSKAHAGSIFRKLNAKNRIHAAVIAIKEGIC